MEQLGVELILAHSPQAKGRVEQMYGVRQDRLVKARRRAGISDLARANASLARTYLPEHHRKFQKAPTRPADAHRSVPRGRNQELSREAEPKRVRRETRPAATPPEAEAGDRECARGPGAAARGNPGGRGLRSASAPLRPLCVPRGTGETTSATQGKLSPEFLRGHF